MNVLTNLVSWPFMYGVVAGFMLSRIWEIVKVCQLDKLKPLPGGAHRSKWKAIQVDSHWLTAAVAVVFLVWSVLTTQDNAMNVQRIASDAREFAADTRDCQNILIESITKSREVTAEYNRQSQAQRAALANWLRTLLAPPPEIAALDGANPVRQQWAVNVTMSYFNTIKESQNDQSETNAKRPPLPDPNCK